MLTRGKARKWQAEGKRFDNPAKLGKDTPVDPARITKRRTTGAGTRAIKASSSRKAGGKIKKPTKKKATYVGAKKTIDRANAAAKACEDAAFRR